MDLPNIFDNLRSMCHSLTDEDRLKFAQNACKNTGMLAAEKEKNSDVEFRDKKLDKTNLHQGIS